MDLAIGIIVTRYEYLQWLIAKGESQKYGFERLIARCERNWNGLAELPVEQECAPFVSDWTKDLDLFGNRSLYRWFSLAMSHTGARTIALWMTEWVSYREIKARQEAVQELCPLRAWRMRFYEIACASRNQDTSPEAILKWVNSPNHYQGREWQYYLTLTGPITIPIGVVVLMVSIVSEWQTGQIIGLASIIAGVGLNLLLSMIAIGPIHDLFHRLGAANRELQALIDWLMTVKELETNSSKLKSLYNKLFSKETDSIRSILQLQKWMKLAGM